ncbi:MAG: GxxExxY protein [Bacteroidetes bacterium]|nr:GxxExxY protein [Bacteroidota bacterium]
MNAAQNSFTKKMLDDLTYEVVGAAIEVHKAMGKGLLESVYHECMKEELAFRKINFVSELKIPVAYRGKLLQVDFRCDLLVENGLVVELKATNDFHPSFEVQLLNYMNLLKVPKGVLINFNCNNIFAEGQRTYVNEYFKLLL